MVYIVLDEDQKKNCFKKILDRFKKLKVEKNSEHYIIILKNLDKHSLSKLSKYFKINCTSIVCISENLRKNNKFINFLGRENIKYFDGNWLYNYLITDIIEYIILNKKDKLENQEVSILTNSINEIIVGVIKEIANNVRMVNIVTKKEKAFSKLEKELFSNKGIAININNNYNKTLKKSNIILNYDFSEEEINKYEISKNACIINVQNKTKICKKSFEGINIESYNITVPKRCNFLGVYQNEFDKAIIYESMIYKNTLFGNIKKEIIDDKIAITSLNGKNGIIRKNEFSKISKKISI